MFTIELTDKGKRVGLSFDEIISDDLSEMEKDVLTEMASRGGSVSTYEFGVILDEQGIEISYGGLARKLGKKGYLVIN